VVGHPGLFFRDALKSSEGEGRGEKGVDEGSLWLYDSRLCLEYVDGISVKSIFPIARCVTLPPVAASQLMVRENATACYVMLPVSYSILAYGSLVGTRGG